MNAKSSAPHQKNPFSMEPLRARIEDTFQKLGGKLKSSKRRISEENDADQQAKQARTLPANSSPSSGTLGTFFTGGLPPFTTPSQATASFYTSQSQACQSNPSPSYPGHGQPPSVSELSSVTEPMWAGAFGQGGSSASSNLIDLTDSSPSAGSTFTNPIDLTTASTPLSDANSGTAMDVLGSRFPHQDQDLQILEDEQLARTMQQGFDRGSLGLGSQFDSSDLEMAVNSPSFGSLEHLRAYGRDLLNTKCCKCKTSLVGCAESIVSRTREQLKQGCLHPLLRCPNSGCRARTCVGCGDYSYCTTAFDSIKSKAKESLVWWWCDKARIFLAFSLLCGPEFKQLDILNNQTAPQPITERLRTRFKHSKSDAGPSVSEKVQAFEKGAKPAKLSHKSARRADSQLSKGTGYGGSESSSSSLHKIIHRAKTGSTPEEQTWESYFRALAIVLPDSGRIREQDGTTFDAIPQPLLFAMISRSPLLRKASELLRNDSIEEIATQVQLYAALFDFLESVRSHRDTVCTLYYHQCLYSLPEQLLHACLSPTVPVDSKLEITEPLHEIVKKFAVPCAYFLQMVSSHSQSFQLEEEQALIALTKRFCGVAKAQEEGYQRLFGKKEARRSQEIGAEMLPMSSVTTRARGLREAEKRQDKIKEQAEAWHREHRVKELCDDKILSSFYFATKAESLGLARPAPGRMKKLITQLASLRTDLPEGIYIRHASSRVDVMKVLIIGPADTPYENGLFEFDLFCGEKWPVAPPEMQFRTTGGGAVTFNPNLYNNGKVCLSLLGTWQGPSWEPNMSTILQVLISIQAMIFNDQPWYNEPGRETHLDKNQCKLYNQQIQQHTVQHAILYWLNNRLSQPGKGKAPAIAAKPLPARPGPKTSGAPSQYPISLLAKQYSQKPSQSGSLTDTPPPGWYEWYEYEHHHGPHPLLPKPLPTDTQFHQSHGGLSQQATGPDSGTFGIGGFGLGAPSKFPPAPQPPPPGTTKYGNAINGSLNNEAGNWDEWHNFKPSSGSLHPPSMKGAGGSAGIHPPSNPVQNDAQMKLKLQQLKLQQQEMLHLQMMYSQQKEIELALGKDIMSTTDAQKMAHDLAGLGGSYYTPLQPPPAPISLDRAPIGNTTVDSNDDYVWGDVVRKHFELRASSIVATAKRWQKEWPKDSKLVSELEETLTKHGFQ